ncbi:NXPE family member 1-like [Ascaphus truei]|uniref:NXPE family member 1-like n=1 Tax=Ascaphus truei TaxID=8439 RepID=UPI003F59165A
MFLSNMRSYSTALAFVLIIAMLISFSIHQKFLQPAISLYSPPLPKSPEHIDDLEAVEDSEKRETELKVSQIMKDIDRTIPIVTFVHKDNTTSAKNSRATLINPKDKYCVGDPLIFQADVFDYLGKRKNYGGDFLRARIYSPELQAGASGSVEDFGNGTYQIVFTLFWEGKVKISILLHHPSEGVSALWRVKNMDYANVYCKGKFASKAQEVISDCAFHLETTEETCDYLDERDGEFFYCVKPPDVPCDAFIALQCFGRKESRLTALEWQILTQSNIAVEIPKNVAVVDVMQCHGNYTVSRPKCATGMSPPFPGGYFLKDFWTPLFCDLSSFELVSRTDTCLSGKRIYLIGDSTLRQWVDYFPSLMSSLKFFNLHESGWESQSLQLDTSKNIYVHWEKHRYPFLLETFYTVKSYSYVARQIDHLPGGSDTIIVFTLGHHFRPFPLSLLIRRLLNARKAVERILLRSPGTKVVFKTENTRELNSNVERLSDFHGYIQYFVAKTVFQGLNIGIIDVWDMTNAFDLYSLHPADHVLKNQINLFLAYVC